MFETPNARDAGGRSILNATAQAGKPVPKGKTLTGADGIP
jgi:hypothetical protein